LLWYVGVRLPGEELIGKLGTIVAQVEVADFAAPAIAVIGAVVNLHYRQAAAGL